MLRIALVGTGAVSDVHIDGFLRCRDDCAIVALVDQDVARARDKARQHGLAAQPFASLRELLDAMPFDAAAICLPPFVHAEAAIELARAGKHVLVEKPMAPTLAECDAMLAAAREAGVLLGVVAQNRYRTPMRKVKALLDEGAIGRVLHAQVDSYWWRGDRYYDLWWRGTWDKEGGGCTINHAVHHVDLLHWMMGMPQEVRATTLNLAHDNSEVEDFSSALMRYADGRVAQFTASLVHHGEDQQLVFQGERAKIGVPWQVAAMRQRENGFPDPAPEVVAQIQRRYDALPSLEVESHAAQIANFVAAVRGREPLEIDGEQGRRTIELVSAIYQSSHDGAPVRLPLAPDAPFYTREGVLANARRFHAKTRSVAAFADNAITFGRDYGR